MTPDDHPSRFPLPFSSEGELAALAEQFGTPLYVHHEDSYRRYARTVLETPNAYGLYVRYAMKANPHRAVLRIFDRLGIGIDASSYYEVRRALSAGIAPDSILLSSQETQSPERLRELVELGVQVNCTSLAQLQVFAGLFPHHDDPVSVRINPGLGSGHNHRTNTAGPAASFGIWHEYLPRVLEIASTHGLRIARLHSHVGSGSDWRIWQKAASLTLAVARRLPEVETLNLGGGYRIDRMHPQNSIDFQVAFAPVQAAFEQFARETGRRLKLEIEPGTFLAANSCLLLARIQDIVDTGPGGYTFLKLDASMTELLRPMLYGDRHPLRLLGRDGQPCMHCVVVGTCCESGDLFTPRQGDPEELEPVLLPNPQIGDLMAVLGSGAYGLAMAARNYNSRPACAEVMLASDGSRRLITRREEPEEMWGREICDRHF